MFKKYALTDVNAGFPVLSYKKARSMKESTIKREMHNE